MDNRESGSDIRKTFIDFFLSRGHTFVPSASLVPGNDPTLLFTNAGMVQFKEIFLGTERKSYTRAVNSQKCMRVAGKHNDLDDVGRDDTHHTFFEMLGNWSFGDYYKKEAIEWAWELLTKVWGLDTSRIWITCFKDELNQIPPDIEAAQYWRSQPGIEPEHILFFGRKDNLWEMAETGPCGPCSEIHFDLGQDRCKFYGRDPGHKCEVNGDCGRFLEIWNLVFIQYNRIGEAHFDPLPQKHVDTGMGFERIVSILQDKKSNYMTDLFAPILDTIQKMTGHTNLEREVNITPYRVIADHIRAASFLIADGVIPGNVTRNYVCRMIIRRAALFGRKIGLSEPFLYKLAEIVIENYGAAYPELRRSSGIIIEELKREENRFRRTVDNGLAQLSELLSELASSETNKLEGAKAFELYATHGLPLEITKDIARENGFEVDEQGFHEAMNTHREISSTSRRFEALEGEQVAFYQKIFEELVQNDRIHPGGVHYTPYGDLEVSGELLALIKEGIPVHSAQKNDKIETVIPVSPFYIESGGQVSDTGKLVGQGNVWEISVENSFRPCPGLIVLSGTVLKGSPVVGDQTIAMVDRKRRLATMRNHTATHLLHAALKKVLGAHARQAGSLVAPDYLRFDFTHPAPVSEGEIQQIESLVNQEIYSEHDLFVRTKSLEEAIDEGAVALFGEKYGEEVRTIAIGEEKNISYELCGGTHVENTGQIGIFLIKSEGSVASGIRRIEAVTGEKAFELVQSYKGSLQQSASLLNTPPKKVPTQIEKLKGENEDLQKQLQKLNQKLAERDFLRVLDDVKEIDGAKLLTAQLQGVEPDTLRTLTDKFREKYSSGVIVLGSIYNDKPVLIAAITENLVNQGLDAVDMIRTISKEFGGGGGGKPTLAQAGGKNGDKLPLALELAEQWVRTQLNK